MDGESLWNWYDVDIIIETPELKEKIFVPFFTTKTEGTGIGLSLCRQIIKRHGGNFYLQESRQGKTIFVIEWPVASFILK